MTSAKRLGLIGASAATLAFVLAPAAGAWYTPKANVTLDCRRGAVVAEFHYSDFNPANQYLKATERIRGAATATKVHTLELDGEGDDTGVLRAELDGSGRVRASTVVVSASGRVKASDEATIRCSPPPPPEVVKPKASLTGPCWDPMYRATFNNRASTKAVTFRWRYHDFARGTVTKTKTVGAGNSWRSPWEHLRGQTPTTIRAAGKLLLSRLTAPGGWYPC